MIPQGRGFQANFAISACFAPVEVSEVGGVSLERGSVFVDQEAEDGDGLAVLDGDEEQPHKVHQRVRVRRAPEMIVYLSEVFISARDRLSVHLYKSGDNFSVFRITF